MCGKVSPELLESAPRRSTRNLKGGQEQRLGIGHRLDLRDLWKIERLDAETGVPRSCELRLHRVIARPRSYVSAQSAPLANQRHNPRRLQQSRSFSYREYHSHNRGEPRAHRSPGQFLACAQVVVERSAREDWAYDQIPVPRHPASRRVTAREQQHELPVARQTSRRPAAMPVLSSRFKFDLRASRGGQVGNQVRHSN